MKRSAHVSMVVPARLAYLVVSDLDGKLAQRSIGGGVGAVEPTRLDCVLLRARTDTDGYAQLPLATFALGLVALELGNAAGAGDLCYGYSPSPTT